MLVTPGGVAAVAAAGDDGQEMMLEAPGPGLVSMCGNPGSYPGSVSAQH